MDKDYYKILGIPASSSCDEIKKAYRSLALIHHPDKNGGDQESESRFKDIAEAYSVLSDPEKRLNYDKTLEGPIGGFRPYSVRSNEYGFKSFWEKAKTPPRAINTSISISFKDSIVGLRKTIKYSLKNPCPSCKPITSNTKLKSCPKCFGSGKLRHNQGYISVFLKCNECRGLGQVRVVACKQCGGEGEVSVEQASVLNVPAGIVSGNMLRLSDRRSNAILMVKVHVLPDLNFKRKGADIYSKLEISLKEALLGCSKEVPLIRESKSINIPSCIQSGTKMRVKGQGAKNLDTGIIGDHFIEINIKMPENLSEAQRKAVSILDD